MSEELHSENQESRSEKIWRATRRTISSATFRANQYKYVVQKKIDLGAVHKKIDQLHAELGKMIDDCREAGHSQIMERDEVVQLLHKLDSLKKAAALLEEEIETIRSEMPPAEELDEDQANDTSGKEDRKESP
ncbi:MAG: hypothetical protein C0619_04965 [Desulfuromonas sp.]|jgi:uncharacterized membrane protein|nr:MAG: hypothetical protein C0619_04965 [Desulfuromonas sp.]